MNFEGLTNIIKERKTTYAYDFSEKKIEKEIIEAILTNALWAPTHKLTQPWRFVVLEGNHPKALGEFMAEYYKSMYSEDDFPKERYESTKSYALNATIVAIILSPSTRVNLPEWEEIAAVSCAVQNIWLSCTTLGIGGYWDTAAATMAYGEKIVIETHEKFLGLFLMGYPKKDVLKTNRKRKPLSKKLTYIKI